jgi:predicted nucleotidyltransferase
MKISRSSFFGSRARKENHAASDFDIGLIARNSIRLKIALLKKNLKE